MTDDPLTNLLLQADRSAPHPSVPDHLADRVRRLARHRRQKTTRLLSAAALLLIALGIVIIFGNSPRTIETAPPQNVGQAMPAVAITSDTEIAQLRVEIAQLRAEADARTEIIKQLLAYQKQQAKLARLERQLASFDDPLAQIQQQLEDAAFTTLYLADRKYNEMNLKDSALRDYHQIIKLYPQTKWAQTARQRLTEIEKSKFL
jgi:septal ring factor EnvC (AmiA/AmiB activator)